MVNELHAYIAWSPEKLLKCKRRQFNARVGSDKASSGKLSAMRCVMINISDAFPGGRSAEKAAQGKKSTLRGRAEQM